MRRKDRQMDKAFAWDVFDRAPYAVLAVTDEDGAPYCVPVSPARVGNTVYFHCAREGKKTDGLGRCREVCLTSVSRAEPAGWTFSMEYESAVIRGSAFDVTGKEEKIQALSSICSRYAPEDMGRFDAAAAAGLEAARVIRVEVREITGKQNRYGADDRKEKTAP